MAAIYNTEVVEMTGPVMEALEEIEDMMKKGAQALTEIATELGSPKVSALVGETVDNINAMVKPTAELREHVQSYRKTYQQLEESL